MANIIDNIFSVSTKVADLLAQSFYLKLQQQSKTMEPVNSTAIESILYDDTNKVATVTFTDGSRYQYLNVSPSEYMMWLMAPSIGQYFNKYIKAGFHPFIRL